MPWSRGNSPVSAAPDYEDYLFEQWSHGVFDDYWKQPGIWAEGFYDRYAAVPVVHLSGWYDPYARTATENYVGLSRAGRGPQRLILGPWTHGDRSLSYAGEVDFGDAAPVDGNLAEDFFDLRRRWFDHWMRGVPNGVEAEPAVRVFVMGGGSGRRNRDGRLDHGGCWRAASEWPLPETRWTRFYLHPDRGPRHGAAGRRGRARLCLRPAQPGADAGRRDQLGRAGHAGRRVRPERGRQPSRRAGLHDAAARRRSRNRRAGRRRVCGSPPTRPTPISPPS